MTAHPSDKRYQHLFGKKAITPLFDVPIPIFPSEEADPEKGTGILMVCTFGDALDVEWWKREKLPLRQIIGKNGRILSLEFGKENWPSLNRETANLHLSSLVGTTVKSARAQIVELLKVNESGIDFTGGDPRETVHSVRYYEKGKRPLEILSSRQWFLSTMDKKEELLKKGEELNWYPDHMRKRYSDWTENLKFDWCISRQRFFGVPIPVWYRLNEKGQADMSNPILPDPRDLPVDPSSDSPRGFLENQRDETDGFTAEKDIFDTWFTSSLTPQICSGWGKAPMTIRPQSHEIIRTWTFYTIVQSMLHEKSLPWKNVLISGWILDNERKKMSKSKGNPVTPESWFDKYGADSLRYWSAGARLGTDTAFDENILKSGRKLVTKLFNASKFVFSFPIPEQNTLEELDLSFLSKLRSTMEKATLYFQNFNYSKALGEIETFFWDDFTDSYLELVKARAKEKNYSAIFTLRKTLNILLRAFAPFLPFITEEMWFMGYSDTNPYKSIHISTWPGERDFSELPLKNSKIFELASRCLSAVHSRKSEAGVSLKTKIDMAEWGLHKEDLTIFHHIEKDLKQAGWISRFKTSESPDQFLKVKYQSISRALI